MNIRIPPLLLLLLALVVIISIYLPSTRKKTTRKNKNPKLNNGMQAMAFHQGKYIGSGSSSIVHELLPAYGDKTFINDERYVVNCIKTTGNAFEDFFFSGFLSNTIPEEIVSKLVEMESEYDLDNSPPLIMIEKFFRKDTIFCTHGRKSPKGYLEKYCTFSILGSSLDKIDIKRLKDNDNDESEILEIDYRKIATMIRQLSQSIIDLNNAGIIHADISPGNVLVTRDGNAKVFDFNLATLSHFSMKNAYGNMRQGMFQFQKAIITGDCQYLWDLFLYDKDESCALDIVEMLIEVLSKYSSKISSDEDYVDFYMKIFGRHSKSFGVRDILNHNFIKKHSVKNASELYPSPSSDLIL